MSCISKFEAIDQIFQDFETFQTKSIYEIISREDICSLGEKFKISSSYARFGSKGLDFYRLSNILEYIREFNIPEKYVDIVKDGIIKKSRSIKNLPYLLEREVDFFKSIFKAVLSVKLGYGECNEFNRYFFAKYFADYLKTFKGAILSLSYFNSEYLDKSHGFSILLNNCDSIETIARIVSERNGFISFDELVSKLSENDILVDAFHKERCYLKDIEKEAIKTLNYIKNYGLNFCNEFIVRSEKDLYKKFALEIAFDSSEELKSDSCFINEVFKEKTIISILLRKAYYSENKAVRKIIRNAFPEINFRDTGPLLIADISKESFDRISSFLESEKIEFYHQEKTDDIISLLINCYHSS